MTLCCFSEAQGSSAGGQTRGWARGASGTWEGCWPPAFMFYTAAGGRRGKDVRVGHFLSPLGPRQEVRDRVSELIGSSQASKNGLPKWEFIALRWLSTSSTLEK